MGATHAFNGNDYSNGYQSAFLFSMVVLVLMAVSNINVSQSQHEN
ncbi:MAG: hypothetical protein QS721_11885 [Candidatus Endonucleobacter sp. (ex Gigantidas childressi)]|nr:hypothetical protein [Candidatus Endonucleobacter sp. (ex Gigantidas childressi)]